LIGGPIAVLSFLVGREILSPEWAERILSWRHTGFNVHSLVRTKTKPEAERVGKYMIRPLLSLDRLSFLEPEGKIGYRWGRGGAEQERMDYLEFIARATSPIPDKGQVMVRYYGLYANAHRGKVKKASMSPSALRMAEEDIRRIPSKGWAEMIRCPRKAILLYLFALIYSIFGELENVLDGRSKGLGDFHSEVRGRDIDSVLDRVDGLAGHAHAMGQFLLGPVLDGPLDLDPVL
jgi:hypothetical protein